MITSNAYGLPQDETDRQVNSLLVNPERFSTIACMDGRMFGVVTACDSCNIEINPCVRRHLPSLLYKAQFLLEKQVGYAVTPQYHVEHIQLGNDYVKKIQLKHRGLDVLNVLPHFSGVVDTVPISPFVIDEAETYSTDNGLLGVRVPIDVVQNPSHCLLRINGTIQSHDVLGKENGFWEFVIGNSYHESIKVAVQHCFSMRVRLPELEYAVDGQIVPTYANSTQIIPHRVEDGWAVFSPWVLIDPAFADETIDLHRGEFYKLLDKIDFRVFAEIYSSPVVVMDDETEVTPRIKVVSSERGVIECHVDKKLYYTCRNTNPVALKIWYKTSPRALPFEVDLKSAEMAIANMAAAELPLKTCGCPVTSGFISEAQTKYDEIRINPVTGDVIATPKKPSENLFGKIQFWENVSRMKRFLTPGRI